MVVGATCGTGRRLVGRATAVRDCGRGATRVVLERFDAAGDGAALLVELGVEGTVGEGVAFTVMVTVATTVCLVIEAVSPSVLQPEMHSRPTTRAVRLHRTDRFIARSVRAGRSRCWEFAESHSFRSSRHATHFSTIAKS